MLLISFLRSYFTLYTVKTVLVVYNVIYDSQFPLASSRFGRGSAESLSLRGEVGHTGKATRTQIREFPFF